ncbi:transcription factor bHLH118-like [Olea europaea subsp. europaea]|uniref:Transcription factor bHLH118-like n=1 Tax=Olea europaea subsp. europaea TaxID=158383 RepID=A0A8S0S1F9_OLEEU|nr:transcription factor bHLH118-like [Olea europaea subsp. europaea]
MFPFQHGDELVFQPPSVIREDQIQEDLNTDHTLQYNNPSSSSWEKGPQRSLGIQENNGRNTFYESNIKKLIHRDIERQRRKEMANRYASLRSLVPPEHLKGKKSLSDLIEVAVNYIIDTKKNIKKLGLQRDKLKMLSNSGTLSANVGSSSSYSPDLVRVNPFSDGVEILISSFKEEGFPLSNVLVELLERGLIVVSCSSVKENESSLHIIQCEARGLKCNVLATLQKRLTDVINLGCKTS